MHSLQNKLHSTRCTKHFSQWWCHLFHLLFFVSFYRKIQACKTPPRYQFRLFRGDVLIGYRQRSGILMLMVMTRQSRKKYLKKDHVDPILGTVQMQAVCIGYFPRAHTHTHRRTHTRTKLFGHAVQTSGIKFNTRIFFAKCSWIWNGFLSLQSRALRGNSQDSTFHYYPARCSVCN